MNCPKCKSSNKTGAKFCTSCGNNFDDAGITISSATSCNNCNTPLKKGAKFCVSCGESVKSDSVESKPKVDNSVLPNQQSISVTKDRIFWNVQQGEVAHRFTESELIQYDSARGIIINEGTTAYIRVNGVEVAEMKGGTYDFVEPQKLEEILNTRQGGMAGGLRNGFRFLSNLVLGTRVKDKIKENKPDQNQNAANSLNGVIESMKKGQVFSVTLKLDKSFPLVFELSDIKTKILNTTIGVRAFFKIDNFKKFAEYYLSDSSSASTEKIRIELEPVIKASIQEIMHDVEIKDGKLPEDILQLIQSKIVQAASELFYGLKMEKIVEISSNNEDLERFRAISRELYLSEKELDYLVRTNEFSNRLTLTQNSQTLTVARNDADFYKDLTTINNTRALFEAQTGLDFDKEMQGITQERLLTDDEMEKFYMVLSRERKIREAKNEDEINAALIEIEKTGLLREEDLENLKRSIQERNEDHDLNRFHSIDLIQMNQVLEIDRKKLEWEYEIGDKRIELEIERKRKYLQAEIGFSELEIENWKQQDNYKDSRFFKDLERSKAEQLQGIDIRKTERETEIDLDNKEMDAQMERMRKLKELESNEEKQRHEQEMATEAQRIAHQQELEEKRIKEVEIKYKGAKDLSPEQLMAIAANENLDPIAAQKFAESFSAGNNAEQQKEFMDQFSKLNDQRIEDIKQMNVQKDTLTESNMDRVERMFNKMADTSSSMTGHLTGQKDQQKEEYKQRLEKQEERTDKTQDKALDYTTRNNSFTSQGISGTTPTPPSMPMDYFANLPGEQSIPRKIEMLINMVQSGQIIGNTSIFSPQQNTWVTANTIAELAPYFLSPETKQENKSNDSVCKHCGYNQVELEARFCPECGNEPK